MKHGSLFSGIGGFDLVGEWMGWENVFHCENNEFCKKILSYYWPDSISYDDIKQTDFTIHRGEIDILTGGFPCQPYSSAGKRKGKEDERHLWPEMLRAVREIQPGYVVGENVRGLTNWNGGMVFDEVQADLEAEGYEVLPFLLPACAINAPHRRDRIWFIAYSDLYGHKSRGFEQNRFKKREGKSKENKRERLRNDPGRIGKQGTAANTSSKGLSKRLQSEVRQNEDQTTTYQGSEFTRTFTEGGYWQEFPTQSPVCGGNDGLPSELDGITFLKWRNESIKGYGNTIVLQVVFEIFKVIDQINNA